MMRITGGELRSRKVRVPTQDMRPTQDRVREALFSSLGTRVPGARFLDLYAGTGSVGIEAWSRGASAVGWVESSRSCFQVLRHNVQTLCSHEGGAVRCIQAEVDRYLRRSVGKEQADLIFADPPYDPEGSGTRLQKTLHLISQRSILHPAGCLVYEQGLNEPIVEVRGWCLDRAKTYGKTQLLYYQLDPMRYTETIS